MVELDQDHRTVWTYGAAEGLEVPVAAQRLENGNTVIGDSKRGRIIEVDPAGKVDLELREPRYRKHADAKLPPHDCGYDAHCCRGGRQSH